MNTHQITTDLQKRIVQMRSQIDRNLGWSVYDLDDVHATIGNSIEPEDIMLDIMFSQVQSKSQPTDDEILEWTMFCLEASEQPADMIEAALDMIIAQSQKK